MSYRTVKRVLGETSLERKCRFLFGGGLMLLITGSFYFYAWLNSGLVYEQNDTTARMLVTPILLEKHWKWIEPNQDVVPVIEEFLHTLRKDSIDRADLSEYSSALYKADPSTADPSERPEDKTGYQALQQLRTGESEVIVNDQDQYVYYGRVAARESCLTCHYHSHREDGDVEKGDMIGMVKVTLPMKATNKKLAWNNAILLATAIVTAFLAMVAAYAIVRYVIVKPVLHLKDVSDEIARGNLDLRADIHTGDEFEELSHAFNRMLRHLVTVQDELMTVNKDLDGKVDELAEVNLTLYEMNKVKDEFLATMSHELRTPLNSILGFSEVLADSDQLDERQERYVKNIQSSGKSLLLLINDLLDLAKIESGKMDLNLDEFPLGEAVSRQIDSMRPMAHKKNIELSVEIDDRIGEVRQDGRKLEQVLNNLLSNALKFTPEGGRVQVRTRLLDEEHFAVEVEDTGIGIPLEDQATIFDKFRQGHTVPGQRDAMTREYGGTGLGLSIVKELCKLLGGEIELDSEFGRGSTFTVRLPLRVERQTERLGDTFGDLAGEGEEGLTPSTLRRPRKLPSPSSDEQDESAA